ncbi:MAG: hypothetical protein N3E45_09675 [Oscillatoriaceae bacterium SKW80]|nr:hypothetical protein [Oscillatoriaceae bacterium SKYG93]MCX8121084.1 hypothetical protein [Oscillatoriaceae bacterium SKW80]MDW8453586.1 hypothetical protein [Oscillatoriaceae cyanobacterium SKYGB_i_bin93]HIK26937.1 hypothetical protein [Oscillatoriaceae cyanobacterium M7585_C2015_266]
MLPKFNLSELCFQVWKTGYLNKTHRQQIKAALLSDGLNEQDQRLINRLLYAVRRGWLYTSD